MVRKLDDPNRGVTIQAVVKKANGQVSLKPINKSGDELKVTEEGLRCGEYKGVAYQPIDVIEIIPTSDPREAGLVIVAKVRDGMAELAPVDEPASPHYTTTLEALNRGGDEHMSFIRLGSPGDELRTAIPKPPRWALK